MRNIRLWLAEKLIGDVPFAINLRLQRGLYFQADAKSGKYINIFVDYEEDVPDAVGMHFANPINPHNIDMEWG